MRPREKEIPASTVVLATLLFLCVLVVLLLTWNGSPSRPTGPYDIWDSSDPLVQTRRHVTLLHGLIEMYAVRNGAYPERLEQLWLDAVCQQSWDDNPMTGRIERFDEDAYGGLIRYHRQDDAQKPFGLLSPGPDRKIGTDDDITNGHWNTTN